ncbi:hypothetical protein K3495_g10738 [Podosphaera aphanis]|nr:hypothetical protein K3495_g10738 [Podosphaera aphanis]
MGGWSKEDHPEEFIEFLDRANNDPTRVKRAANELHNLKMGEKQRWTSFFPIWANKLTEAQGDMWPDENKITLIERALNKRLLHALAGNHLLPDNDFTEYITIINKVSHQVDHLQGLTSNNFNTDIPRSFEPRNQTLFSSNGGSQPGRVISEGGIGQAGQLHSSGDTIMGGVNVTNVARGPDGQPLRAKWKSKDQITLRISLSLQ